MRNQDHIDTTTTDWVEPLEMFNPHNYDMEYWIDKLPRWARQADMIAIAPSAGIVTPINTVSDPTLLEKFKDGTVELADYADTLTDGVLHYPHSADLDQVGNMMLW